MPVRLPAKSNKRSEVVQNLPLTVDWNNSSAILNNKIIIKQITLFLNPDFIKDLIKNTPRTRYSRKWGMKSGRFKERLLSSFPVLEEIKIIIAYTTVGRRKRDILFAGFDLLNFRKNTLPN
jgi:hypothetical protein